MIWRTWAEKLTRRRAPAEPKVAREAKRAQQVQRRLEKQETLIGLAEENLDALSARLARPLGPSEVSFYAELLECRTSTIGQQLPSDHPHLVTKASKGPIKLVSGLTAAQAFATEVACLRRLELVAKQNGGASHFPRIVWTCPDRLEIGMTRCGTALSDLGETIQVHDLEEQVREILRLLQEAEVLHLDMHQSGKNITVDETGRLYLIDFDIAAVSGFAASPRLQARFESVVKAGGYQWLERRIRSALKRCQYIALP